MNDIHDIYDPIKIIYQNNIFYLILVLLILLLIFFLMRKFLSSRNNSLNYKQILEKKINSLNLNNSTDKLLDELSLILKEYIKYKENIDCKYLTTEEISTIINNDYLINTLKSIDYFKYSYVKTTEKDIKNILINIQNIIKN
ncbi:MAG: hypothetical protein KatS3mg068_1057 [Candidatus Sericytochromatia bacterium]|nr:MAG: hypothetical protein KatS3mg068_1057 [Candidatus Sericytochromatia bacterium]